MMSVKLVDELLLASEINFFSVDFGRFLEET